MKKIILTVFSVVMFTACTKNQPEKVIEPEIVQETKGRIHIVESNNETSLLSIVEIDGREYLVNYHGGIVELTKK